MSIQNQNTMPAGVNYSWMVPLGWTALSPDAAVTQVITNGVTGNYTVSATANDAVCGGNTGSLGVSISGGVNASIGETLIDGDDPETPEIEPNLYFYFTISGSGLIYKWSLFDRTTKSFVRTPLRYLVNRRVTLDEDFRRIEPNDSLVVEIKDASGCVTTVSTVGTNFGTLARRAQQPDSPESTSYEELVTLNEDKDGFFLYPNPAREQTTLEWGGLGKQDLKITLADLAGNKKKSMLINNRKKTDIDLEGLSPGTYILLIQSSKGLFFKKIVVE